ncbi:MAG: transcription factor FapR [Clostridia bacterium]|jgi:acyl-coenzyme A thioesterase PaaI-like protein|nr:transcription factor FapR [Clostridia bacterium]MDH7573896.1 transcription factor FapR [Clostridia bacterium]
MGRSLRSDRRLERHRRLESILQENPFTTDEELARLFGVSVQTVRLDRLALGIPELRERVRSVARHAYGQVRSLTREELVGELVHLELGRTGISILEITPDMVLEKSQIARGHYLFAQANSLAVAVIDAPLVVTGSARVRYRRPVYVGEKVVAKASVKVVRGPTVLVSVHSQVKGELVFKGQFIVVSLKQQSAKEAAPCGSP